MCLPSNKNLPTQSRFLQQKSFKRSDGRMVEGSTSQAVDFGFIPGWVKPMTLKLVFTASMLDAQHQRESVEN